MDFRKKMATGLMIAVAALTIVTSRTSKADRNCGGSDLTIGGVVDRGYINGSNFLELYGDFRGTNNNYKQYRADIDCEGRAVSARVDYESSKQINVAFRLQRSYARCSVSIYDGRGNHSCTFGTMQLTDRGGGRWEGLCH